MLRVRLYTYMFVTLTKYVNIIKYISLYAFFRVLDLIVYFSFIHGFHGTTAKFPTEAEAARMFDSMWLMKL